MWEQNAIHIFVHTISIQGEVPEHAPGSDLDKISRSYCQVWGRGFSVLKVIIIPERDTKACMLVVSREGRNGEEHANYHSIGAP